MIVTLSDNLGQQASTTFTALDTPPAVSAGSNQTVNQGSPVVVAATFTDPGFEIGATPASYPATINWGDGTPSEPDITTGTVTVTPGSRGVATVGTVSGSHNYSDRGIYTVTVSVSDGGGGTGQGSLSATVNDVGPTLSEPPSVLFVQNQALLFQETFTAPGIADQDTVQIDWGDGDVERIDSQSTYFNAEGVLVPVIVEPTASDPVGSIALGHTYQGAGPYTASITITDKDGVKDQVSAVFSRMVEATTTIVTSSTTGNTSVYGQPVTFTATVNPTGGMGTATGTVIFKVNGVAADSENPERRHRLIHALRRRLRAGSHTPSPRSMRRRRFPFQ